MPSRWLTLLFALCLTLVLIKQSYALELPVRACATFASNGALATGLIRDHKLEIQLTEPDSRPKTSEIDVNAVDNNQCEEAFSKDGKWLAVVVPDNKLTIMIVDRKSGLIENRFTSDWLQLHPGLPPEYVYGSRFLQGFLANGSLALWRYSPSDATAGWKVTLHLQRWSIDGDLLSDVSLGPVGMSQGGRTPIVSEVPEKAWINPITPSDTCHPGTSFDLPRINYADCLILPEDSVALPVQVPNTKQLLTVTGDRTAQKVILFNRTGEITASVSLPFFPNLLAPLVPDWFYSKAPIVSLDGQIAAIGRTRVAWVFIDTDRDWGSELNIVGLDPLHFITTLKTGQGGIRAVAVDHRNHTIRLVGFWKNQWHDLRWDESHLGKWESSKIQ